MSALPISEFGIILGVSSFGLLLAVSLNYIFQSRKVNFSYPRKSRGSVEHLSEARESRHRPQSLLDPAEYPLTLIIPAFNEEKRLEKMLKDTLIVFKNVLHKLPQFVCEVILVDDGSKDDTIGLYKRIANESTKNDKIFSRIHFKLLKMPSNSGKGKAVSEGFLACLGENILFADADGSTDFRAVLKFLETMNNRGNRDLLLCGSRCHLGNSQEQAENTVKRSLFRLFLMRCFHLYLRIFGVRSVEDTQCGFKMLNRSAAQKTIPWIHISGWIFDVEMILLAEWKGLTVQAIPVGWREMDGTKLSLAFDSIRMAKDLLKLRLNYFLGLWKYR